jgi:hypothetical protein
VIEAASGVTVTGAYTQLPGSTLELTVTGADAPRLTIDGTATLAGGTLVVRFPAGQTPAPGTTVSLLGATRVEGRFTDVKVEGRKVSPIYSPTGLSLRIDG